METFTLATVSLIIAVSLFIKKKHDTVQLSFAALCLAIFIQKGGSFFQGIFSNEFWRIIDYTGLLAIPPLTVRFGYNFLRPRSLLSKRDANNLSLFSIFLACIFLTPIFRQPYPSVVLYLYTGCTLTVCYLSLLNHIRETISGVKKKRLTYLGIACPIAALLCIVDVLNFYGYGLPSLSDIIIAALLYFVLLIVAYPHLTELHELMARALVIFITTLLATIIFYLITGLFGKGHNMPFTHVLMVSFIIVISLTPLKIILEKIFSSLYPDSRDVFTSLYAFDAKLEREKSLLLEEMAPVLAHEIRNPLGSIKGAAQYLQSEVISPENRKLLDVIIEEADRMNNVVFQFLNYAKPYQTNLKRVNINEIIEKALSIIKANNMSEGIAIEKELLPDLPAVNADGEQIIQVMLNIAFNAIDAMPEGGILSFRTTRIESGEREAVDISIRDTGKGILKDDKKNIFKPFFTTKERGVGLGLSICQRIIKNHGGRIRVKSIPGQGSIFVIRLAAALPGRDIDSNVDS